MQWISTLVFSWFYFFKYWLLSKCDHYLRLPNSRFRIFREVATVRSGLQAKLKSGSTIEPPSEVTVNLKQSEIAPTSQEVLVSSNETKIFQSQYWYYFLRLGVFGLGNGLVIWNQSFSVSVSVSSGETESFQSQSLKWKTGLADIGLQGHTWVLSL